MDNDLIFTCPQLTGGLLAAKTWSNRWKLFVCFWQGHSITAKAAPSAPFPGVEFRCKKCDAWFGTIELKVKRL